MTKRLAISLVAGLVLATFALTPEAASQGSLGTVQPLVPPTTSCGSRNFITGMTCYAAYIHGCPGAQDMQFVYGVLTPSGIPNGTIVFFAGDGGVVAADGQGEQALLARYVAPPANYQVVQIAWGPQAPGQDWEETHIANAPSILVAACRPATFLNWVRNSNTGVGNGLWGGHGGMCAQAHSAGSGALAYALTWYNAGAGGTATNGQGYLDKVTLDAGPVFSNIQLGCTVDSEGGNNNQTLVCVSSGQTGCLGWPPVPPPPIAMSLEYTTGYKTEVNQWSGNNTPQACANNMQQTTYDTAWLNMSILAPSPQNGQTASFNYPNTTMSAYLCETTAPGVLMDNVTAEGQLYYAQFTQQSQAGGALSVYAVTGCPTTEGIYQTPATVVAHNDLASDDMFKDMTSGTSACVSRH